jgi:alkyl hydroperoxide reductase subunit AhpC
MQGEFNSEEIKVVAASVDPIEKTKEYVNKLGLSYPVGYGLDAETVSDLTGAFYQQEKKFLHATAFLVRPDKTIEVAVYSSGPIGRFVPKDILALVKFYKSKAKP